MNIFDKAFEMKEENKNKIKEASKTIHKILSSIEEVDFSEHEGLEISITIQRMKVDAIFLEFLTN